MGWLGGSSGAYAFANCRHRHVAGPTLLPPPPPSHRPLAPPRAGLHHLHPRLPARLRGQAQDVLPGAPAHRRGDPLRARRLGVRWRCCSPAGLNRSTAWPALGCALPPQAELRLARLTAAAATADSRSHALPAARVPLHAAWPPPPTRDKCRLPRLPSPDPAATLMCGTCRTAGSASGPRRARCWWCPRASTTGEAAARLGVGPPLGGVGVAGLTGRGGMQAAAVSPMRRACRWLPRRAPGFLRPPGAAAAPALPPRSFTLDEGNYIKVRGLGERTRVDAGGWPGLRARSSSRASALQCVGTAARMQHRRQPSPCSHASLPCTPARGAGAAPVLRRARVDARQPARGGAPVPPEVPAERGQRGLSGCSCTGGIRVTVPLPSRPSVRAPSPPLILPRPCALRCVSRGGVKRPCILQGWRRPRCLRPPPARQPRPKQKGSLDSMHWRQITRGTDREERQCKGMAALRGLRPRRLLPLLLRGASSQRGLAAARRTQLQPVCVVGGQRGQAQPVPRAAVALYEQLQEGAGRQVHVLVQGSGGRGGGGNAGGRCGWALVGELALHAPVELLRGARPGCGGMLPRTL